MVTVLGDILDQLIIANIYLDGKVWTEDEIIEEKQNYVVFLQALRELNELLIAYRVAPINDVLIGSKNIFKLYTIMGELSWYVQNLHDRVIDILKGYSKLEDICDAEITRNITVATVEKTELFTEKVFSDLLNQLIILNNFLDKKAMTEEDVLEEKQRYNNFLRTMEHINTLLAVYKSTPTSYIRINSSNIKRLHILMNELSVYIENLYEWVRTIIRYYPIPDDL